MKRTLTQTGAQVLNFLKSPDRSEQQDAVATVTYVIIMNVHIDKAATDASACVAQAAHAGVLYVVTAVYISTVVHMTSAVKIEVFSALLAYLLHGGCLDQLALRIMIVNLEAYMEVFTLCWTHTMS